MGYKKKWTDNANESLIELLHKFSAITHPLFANNGIVDLSNLEKKSDLEYILALVLNSKLASSKDKNGRRFGADDVIALKLEIEGNRFLKFWGKINWLSKPKDHKCFRSYQDPFYGLFRFENNQFEIVQAMFGDYDKNDLDGQYWIETEMNWMYEF
ncbi:MAG: hypothetical protein AAF441_01925 [Pseudomonadota bacterium]